MSAGLMPTPYDGNDEPFVSHRWPTPFDYPYNPQIIAYKKLDERAKGPTRNLKTDAGLDLYALQDTVVPSIPLTCVRYAVYWVIESIKNFAFPKRFIREPEDNDYEPHGAILATKVPTGIALEIPPERYGLILDRSSVGSKLLKVFGGVIDSEYRGDVTVCLANFSFHDYKIKAGDKIAQIVIQKCDSLQPYEAKELTETARAANGFGSSGA